MSDLQFPFPDQEASRRILESDPCFKKIPANQVDEIFESAWKVGQSEAERFLAQWEEQPTPSLFQILKKKQFRMEEQDIDYVMGNIRYFCEYMSEKNIICIYRKSVEKWAEKNGFPYETARDLILAHEYFHYLEWHEIGRTSKKYLVPMLKIGPLSFGKTGIAALSEIAANAFANSYYTMLINGRSKYPKREE